MRALFPTLLVAQRSQPAVPRVRAQVLDMLAGVVRPSLGRLYTGAEEEFHHAATAPADGSLVRARVESASKNLFAQRVSDPGPGSDFSSWSVLDLAETDCNVALCSRGASVLLFFIDHVGGKKIYLRESADSATWGSRQTVVLPAVSAVEWLAAAFSASGTVALFYVSSALTVYVTKRTGSVWSTPGAWSNAVSTVTGLACAYTKDWDLALTGTDSGGEPGLWTFRYGDGGDQASGTWSALRSLSQAQGDSDVEFHTPFLASPDVTRLSYMEKYNGVTSSRRMHLLHTVEGTSFDQDQWRDPIPFDLEVDYGLALSSDGKGLWLSYPRGVWGGALTDPPLDVSDDALALTAQEGPEGASFTVVLSNGDGRYGSVGPGRTLPSVRGPRCG